MKILQSSIEKRRGVTLMETVIVLGVAAIILAAVFSAANRTKGVAKAQEGVEQVTEIATRVRTFLTTNPLLDKDGFDRLKQKTEQINRGFFPSVAVVEATKTQNVWGGSLDLVFQTTDGANGGVIKGFTIAMNLRQNNDPLTDALDQETANTLCGDLWSRLRGSGSDLTNPNGSPPLPPLATTEVRRDRNIQDPGPLYVYAYKSLGNGGSWSNVTLSSLTDISGGTTPCTGIAYFFKI